MKEKEARRAARLFPFILHPVAGSRLIRSRSAFILTRYASISFTTVPVTSVSRKSRPA